MQDNTNQTLQNLIREVTENTKDDPPAHRVVVVNTKKKRAIDPLTVKLQRSLNFGTEFKYYMVSNIEDPNGKATGSLIYTYREDPPGKRALDIHIPYAATCPPGNEKKVAASLCAATTPEEAFRYLIFKWIHDYIRSSNNSFIDSFLSVKNALIATVKRKAQLEMGLDLALDLSVSKEPLRVIKSTDSFHVRFRDYDKGEMLNVAVELEVSQSDVVIAQVSRETTPQQLIQTELQNYFAKNVSLQNLYYDVNKSAFKQEVTKHLNQALKDIGHRLIFISMERQAEVSLPPETFGIRHPVVYLPDEDFPPVNVRNVVHMDLQDSARYRISGSPDLSEWVKKELDIAVNAELFGASYMDLLLCFEPLGEKVVTRMRLAANRIGYRLRQLATVPELEPYDWLNYFEVKTESAEELFETKELRFPVQLKIVVNTKLNNLKSVESYLKSRSHIPTEIKNEVLKVTAQFLRSISPERYYVRFDQTSVEGEIPVIKELQARIIGDLRLKFDAEVHSLFLQRGDTEIVRRLNELKQYPHEFGIVVSPLDPNKYDAGISGNFRVMDLDYDGWYTFANSMPTIEHIEKCILHSIHTDLKNDRNINLVYQDDRQLDELVQIITKSATEAVLRDFGLKIALTNVSRQQTEIEGEIKGEVIKGDKAALKQLTQRRAELMQDLVEMMISGASDDQMNALKLDISRLNGIIKEGGSSTQLSLAGMPEQKQLPESTS